MIQTDKGDLIEQLDKSVISQVLYTNDWIQINVVVKKNMTSIMIAMIETV